MKTWSKLKALIRRRKAEAEMAEEIRLHLELQTERNIAAGMDPDEARYAAQRMFGGVEQVKEQCREQRSWIWLEQFGRDLAHAGSSLRHTPGFSGVAIVTLAVVIGANSLVFTLVNGFLFKPVLGDDASAAVHVVALTKGASRAPQRFTREDLERLRANPGVFSAVAGYTIYPEVWGTELGDLRHGMVERVTDGFFAVCGVQPVMGRFFAGPTASVPEVVISDAAWRSLGGDSTVLGRTILVDGAHATVIGVAPRGFGGPAPLQSPDLWLPIPQPNAATGDGGGMVLAIVARLAPGLDLSAAAARLPAVEAQLNESASAGRERQLTLVEPSLFAFPGVPDRLTGGVRVAGVLFVALGAVLLLIASLNLANLLLARGAARRHEIGVRLALGATRSRVVRLLLSESLLLALAGSVVGLLFAGWGSLALEQWVTNAITGRIGFSIRFDFAPDLRVVGATCGYALVMMLAIGVAPALRSTRVDVMEDLKGAGEVPRGTDRIARLFSLRPVLVMGQIAGSLVLVVCAGLFLRFAAEKQQFDAGFDVAHNLVFSVDYALNGSDPRWSFVSEPGDRSAAVAEYHRRSESYRGVLRQHRETVLERVRVLPGVRDAAVAASLIFPNGDSESRQLRAFGTTPPEGEAAATVRAVDTAVSRQYFATLGIPIVAGRSFTAEEERSARPVALLDEQAAARLFPNQSALGQRVVLPSRPGLRPSEPYEIVGLVRGPAESVRYTGRPPRIYRALDAREAAGTRTTALFLHVAVASPATIPAVLAAVQKELSTIDPSLPARLALPMRDHIAGNPALAMLHLGAALFGALGAIGLLVAVVGIYGVKAYTLTQRTREIGVRLALGAEPRQIRWWFLREGALQTGVALAVGLVLALVAGLGVSRVFDSVSWFDPTVTVAAIVLLGGTALLACWLPARRAAKVDPIVALRCE